MNPMIFVSAVSAEFAQSRQLVVNVLTRLGYTPVFQDVFGTESGDLRDVLRRKIDRCEGLIQIVGDGYGAEPPTVDAEFGRVSYTQFEFLYATKKGLKTWVVEVGGGFPRDRPADQLDLPPVGTATDPTAHQQERQALQKAYRATLNAGGHLRHKAADRTDLQLRMEQLRDELSELRAAFEKWQASLAGDVQGVPEAVARRLNPWAWVKRHMWAVGGVLVLLTALAVGWVVWQGAKQQAAAEVAAAADDANRAWDQVKGTDRGQTVGENLDAAEAKLRSAGERSARGDHAGAVREFHDARELARGLIETDLLRRQAVAARTGYETTQKQVGNTFGAPAAGEAVRLFDAGDFPAATAKWDAARKVGEVGQAKKQLDQQLARYDVKRLEPLTPELWKKFREAEMLANSAVESGDSQVVQEKFADAMKALDAATEPARCREAFVLGYVGRMLWCQDNYRLQKVRPELFSPALGAHNSTWEEARPKDLTSGGLQALGLPAELLKQLSRFPTVSGGSQKQKDELLNKLSGTIAAVNGERVENWYSFGTMAAEIEYGFYRQKFDGASSVVVVGAFRVVITMRKLAHQLHAPKGVVGGVENILGHFRGEKKYWYYDALKEAEQFPLPLLDDPDEAVRLIARTPPITLTDEQALMIRLGGSIDRTQKPRVAVRLDHSFLDDQSVGQVATVAEMTLLDLRGTKVTNTGLAKLEKCGALVVLDVRGSRVGPGAGKSLQKIASLEVLRVLKDQLPAAELTELKKALPALEVQN